jgi:chromosome segregation ATPase
VADALPERLDQALRDKEAAEEALRDLQAHIDNAQLAEEEREAPAARVHEERTRQQAALEINDTVVQGLTAALYALELDDNDAVRDYVRRTLDSARAIITDLVGPIGGPIAPGDLVRSAPSTLPD